MARKTFYIKYQKSVQGILQRGASVLHALDLSLLNLRLKVLSWPITRSFTIMKRNNGIFLLFSG